MTSARARAEDGGRVPARRVGSLFTPYQAPATAITRDPTTATLMSAAGAVVPIAVVVAGIAQGNNPTIVAGMFGTWLGPLIGHV